MAQTGQKNQDGHQVVVQRNQQQRRAEDDAKIGFVQHFFEEFYQKLYDHLQSLDTAFSSFASAADHVPGESDDEIVKRTRVILDDLYQTLERQALIAAQKGGEFAVTYYRETQYVMAALADELFLNRSWPGKFYWMENLLETRLFGSYDSGDLFFEKLNNFLEKRDPMRRDVAEVYLLALGLGFKGRYRDMPDERQLDHYRHELYVFINHQEPRLYEGEDRLFPQAYAHTLDGGKASRFQDVKFWTSTFVVVIIILLLSSFLVWNNTTSELNNVTETILKNKSQGN